MATRRIHTETNKCYFITFTCYNWLPLFGMTNLYYDIYSWFDILAKGVSTAARKKGSMHKVFEDSFDCKVCLTSDFVQQKLRYIHHNPVKAGLVTLAEDYVHSSALYYETGDHGPYQVNSYTDHFSILPA